MFYMFKWLSYVGERISLINDLTGFTHTIDNKYIVPVKNKLSDFYSLNQIPDSNDGFVDNFFSPSQKQDIIYKLDKEHSQTIDYVLKAIPEKYLHQITKRSILAEEDLSTIILTTRQDLPLSFTPKSVNGAISLEFLMGVQDICPHNDPSFYTGYFAPLMKVPVSMFSAIYKRDVKNLEELTCFMESLCGEDVDYSRDENVINFLERQGIRESALEKVIRDVDSLFVAKYRDEDGDLSYMKVSHNYRASSSQFFWVNRLREMFPKNVPNPLRVCYNGFDSFSICDGLAVTRSKDAETHQNYSVNDYEEYLHLFQQFKESIFSKKVSDLPKSLMEDLNSINFEELDDIYLQKLFSRTLFQQASRTQVMQSNISKLYFSSHMPVFDELVERAYMNNVPLQDIRTYFSQSSNEYVQNRFFSYFNESYLLNLENFSHFIGVSDIDMNSENVVLSKENSHPIFVDPLLSINVPMHGFSEEVEGLSLSPHHLSSLYFLSSKMNSDYFSLPYDLQEEAYLQMRFTFPMWKQINATKIGAFKLIHEGLNRAQEFASSIRNDVPQ